MREQQKHYDDVRNAEILEAQRMEQAEKDVSKILKKGNRLKETERKIK